MAEENMNASVERYIEGGANGESTTDDVAIDDGSELVIIGTTVAIVENTNDGNAAAECCNDAAGTCCVGSDGCCDAEVTNECCDANCACDVNGDCGKANCACANTVKCCDGYDSPSNEIESVDDNIVENEVVSTNMSVSSKSSTGQIVDMAQPLFTSLVVEVKQRMTGSSISSTTVMVILKYAMEAVELSKVKGAEQKELALDIVRQVIIDAPLSPTAESACMMVIDSGILMGVVDLVVDATKGRLNVNQVKKRGIACFRRLGCMKA